jgi:hypothetical protein
MLAEQITHLTLEVLHQPFVGFHADPQKQPMTGRPACERQI